MDPLPNELQLLLPKELQLLLPSVGIATQLARDSTALCTTADVKQLARASCPVSAPPPAHSPLYTGLRFSLNAASPSSRSAVGMICA